jgi:molecular chaperone IbpA
MNLSTINPDKLMERVRRDFIGFDKLFSLLEDTALNTQSYPPFNIEQVDAEHWLITLAVAGFREEDLAISLQDKKLIIAGTTQEAAAQRTFLHRGIAQRAFERIFVLADAVEVKSVTLQDGLLAVSLERLVPEASKPRQIEITRIS